VTARGCKRTLLPEQRVEIALKRIAHHCRHREQQGDHNRERQQCAGMRKVSLNSLTICRRFFTRWPHWVIHIVIGLGLSDALRTLSEPFPLGEGTSMEIA
jgi:hypothetical protein